MAVDQTQERQQAHVYLDLLPPEKLSAVRSLLETMVDPLDRQLAMAPFDDEPETEEERHRAAEGVESLGRNGGVPMEAVLADFGLTMDDFHSMAQEHPAEAK